MNKVIKSLREAVSLSGLKDSMTISFHHHLRNGDTIASEILKTIACMGFHDIRVASSSLLDSMDSIIELIKEGVVTGLDATGVTKPIGIAMGNGLLKNAMTMRTHGGRPQAIEKRELLIDVAFIAASAADENGNCSGFFGPSAFGSMGYAFADARHAKKVVVITDHLTKDPLVPASIDQSQVDFVVPVDSIGDPAGIQTKTIRVTKDPTSLRIAELTAGVIEHSGLLKEGFCFQSGAGGISLAVTQFVKELMLQREVQGRFGLGGITGALVDMLELKLFKVLYDVQSFDTDAVASIAKNGLHREIPATLYANPESKGCLVNDLDCVVLSATEVDVDFNVNVHTDSNNVLISGAGGHGDTAAGAKLAIITAPAMRSRVPIVVDRVNTVSTPGRAVDVLVTQFGVSVNTALKKNEELAYRLKDAGIRLIDIHDLKTKIEGITGKPQKPQKGEKTIAYIVGRDGKIQDEVKGFA